MQVETYIEMKKTFLDLTGPDSKLWLIETNPLFSIVYDRDEKTIWAGWRPRTKDAIPNAVYYELTDLEAQNFNMQIYEKAINTLLYKAKQENLKDKLKKIEKDFK
jgi:hypothetical protein